MSMILFSGCSITLFDSADILAIPKPTGYCAEIQTILNNIYGDDVSLVYPNRGDYCSAVTMMDLNGTGTSQAVVLYEEGRPRKLHMMLVDNKNGSWVKINDFVSEATEVDKICFEDLDNDGVKEVIISYKTAGSLFNKVGVYVFKDNEYKEILLRERCADFVVGDFDNDKQRELLLLSIKSGTSIASGKLIKINENELIDNLIGVVQLDSRVTGYSQVLVGRINEYQYGVVIDGNIGPDRMLTEIIYWDEYNKKLMSPLYNLKADIENFSIRDNNTMSKDINNDGIIEIPSVLPSPGYWDSKSGLLCFYTAWNVFDTISNSYDSVENMFINYIDGYYFKIPDIWIGCVTAKIEAMTKTLTFSRWVKTGFGTKASGEAILKIQVFSASDWEVLPNKNDFVVLEVNKDNVYVANLTMTEGKYALDRVDVKNRFKLVNYHIP